MYVETAAWERADDVTRYLARIHAAAAIRQAGVVFSHQSAAALLGLPQLGAPPLLVHATTSPSSRRRSRSGIAWHHVDLRPDDVGEVNVLSVTSVGRTLVDIARTGSFAEAVVVLDAAIEVEDTDSRPRWDSSRPRIARGELFDRLKGLERAPGTKRARVALEFADGRAESIGESLSRVQMHAWGVSLPDLQVPMAGASGRRYRVDFAWRDGALVGEFDGRLKYSRDRFFAADSADRVVWAEKRREDDLRARAHDVVRWTWDDIVDGHILVRALARHGLRASRTRPLPVFTKGIS